MSADQRPRMDSPQSVHVGHQPSIDIQSAVALRVLWRLTHQTYTGSRLATNRQTDRHCHIAYTGWSDKSKPQTSVYIVAKY